MSVRRRTGEVGRWAAGVARRFLRTSGGTLFGHLLFSPDGTYDIGASGATRPRHLYLNGSAYAVRDLVAGVAQSIAWSTRTNMTSPADGKVTVKNAAGTHGVSVDVVADVLAVQNLAATGPGGLCALTPTSSPGTVGVTAAQTGLTFANDGASALVTFTLPTAAAGLRYTFVVTDADGLKALAASGDTIRLGASVSGAAGFATSTTIGDVLTLVAVNDTEWIATAYAGTWTVT